MSGAATPHAPASARASLPPGTGSATPALQAPAPASGLPPPTTFDILPDLHKLLKRIIDAPPADTPSHPATADGPLEIQHVATAATDIRLKIQRAQRAVMSLPEIDRTCEDQEEEIEDLEARIARLKASLRELGRPAETTEDRDAQRTSIDCMDALDMALAQTA